MSLATVLAEWITLSPDAIGSIYTEIRPNGPAKRWSMLNVEHDSNALILAACQEAENNSFLHKFTQAVIAAEEEVKDRKSADIRAFTKANPGLLGQGMAQSLMNEQRGFMNARILPKVVRASQACARVVRTSPGKKALGTAFLVKPNMVMTAAHVVLERNIDTGQWGDELLQGIEFEFETDAPASNTLKAKPKKKNPLLSHAKPHASVGGNLILSDDPPADENLDFALVELDRPIFDVPVVPINNRATVEKLKACWAFGHPEGADLIFDVNSVIRKNEKSGRWHHKANTVPGMSGGVCINHVGQLVGIHEGSVKFETNVHTDSENYNRGVSIKAIRRQQLRNGQDPLGPIDLPSLVEFRDSALVTKLYEASINLVPKAYVSVWDETIKNILGVIPDGSVPTTPFHPWFKRKGFEDWIDNDTEANRLAFIYGERGTGKSFCTDILRAKLDLQAVDLVALNDTETGAIDWKDTWARAIDAQDLDYRTRAASMKYSGSDAIINDLKQKWTQSNRKRYLVLDFGYVRDGRRFERSPWFDLIKVLLMNEWVRVILIGLNQNERNALIYNLLRHSATQRIDSVEYEMKHITKIDFTRFAMNLATSRGKSALPEVIGPQIESVYADFSGTEKFDLQTCGAALAGIQLGIAYGV